MKTALRVSLGVMGLALVACSDDGGYPAPVLIAPAAPVGSAAPGGSADSEMTGAEASRQVPGSESEEPTQTADGGVRDAGDGGKPAANVIPCDKPNTCASARKSTIASVDGDGSQIQRFEFRGSTAEFVKLRVLESSSLLGRMKVKATLVSPQGKNFDLVVYRPEEDIFGVCPTSAAAIHANDRGDDVVTSTWDDDAFADDSRTLTFEVRHASGTCTTADADRWVLRVEAGGP